MNKSYAKAYTEVLEVLNVWPKEEYEKIPKEEIEFLSNNSDKEYDFKFEKDKSLEEQNISRKANAVLVILFRDYIATEKQKEKLKEILEYNYIKEQKRARKKYNPENILKKENIREVDEQDNDKLIEYKESWFRSIINKIKNSLIEILKKVKKTS